MIVPQPLEPGDKIGLIAPSRKITPLDIEEPVKLIESWGYKPVYGKSLFNESDQFAGSDQERAQDLMDMIMDPDIKAILCVRGGYGTIRILDQLDSAVIRKNPKWLIGYSDITVLHSFYHSIVGMETIHAVMPINCNPSSEDSDTWIKLRGVLAGNKPDYKLPGSTLNKQGNVTGTLVGGNLSVLYSLRGTYCDLDTNGKILFIEDLDEYLYHIDRMMMNLKVGGKLEKLKGLIVGGMTEMKDNTIPFGKTAEEIVADAVRGYNFPVAFNFPAGHCDPNLPLIFGREVSFSVEEKFVRLSFRRTSLGGGQL